MKITRDNYALFFLDHFEGRLSEADRKELIRFLVLHPDLKAEFDSFEEIPLHDDDSVVFPDKASLKKIPQDKEGGGQTLRKSTRVPVEAGWFIRTGMEGVEVDPDHYEMAFAAYVEGDLDASAQRAVEAFAASSTRYGRELALMRRTKLLPGDHLPFPYKKALKQHRIGTARQRLWYATSAAAAVLLLAMVTFSLFPLRDVPQVALETPVDGEMGQPGAVADAPSPQQEAPTPMPPQPQRPVTAETRPGTEQEPPAPALQHDATPPRHVAATAVEDSHREQLPAPTMPRPLLAGRLESLQITGMPERDMPAPATMETRKEFLWLAYRDRAETPFGREEDDEPGRSSRYDVSLVQLAMGHVGQSVGVDLRGTDGAVAGDRPVLLDLAGRGLAGLNNMLGQPVVVDGERRDDGTQVQLAIGDFFEVTRKSGK